MHVSHRNEERMEGRKGSQTELQSSIQELRSFQRRMLLPLNIMSMFYGQQKIKLEKETVQQKLTKFMEI